jgi:hypothetical protein
MDDALGDGDYERRDENEAPEKMKDLFGARVGVVDGIQDRPLQEGNDSVEVL